MKQTYRGNNQSNLILRFSTLSIIISTVLLGITTNAYADARKVDSTDIKFDSGAYKFDSLPVATDGEGGAICSTNGSIYVNNNASLTVTNNSAKGSVSSRGGGLYASKNIIIQSTAAQIFKNNKGELNPGGVGARGGAMFAERHVIIDAPHVEFIGNSVLGATGCSGGAIGAGGNVTLKGTVIFNGNTATKGGGAIFSNSSNPVITLSPTNASDSIAFETATDTIMTENAVKIIMSGAGTVMTNAPINSDQANSSIAVNGGTFQLGSTSSTISSYVTGKYKEFTLAPGATLAFFANSAQNVTDPLISADIPTVTLSNGSRIKALISEALRENPNVKPNDTITYKIFKNQVTDHGATFYSDSALYKAELGSNDASGYTVKLVRLAGPSGTFNVPSDVLDALNHYILGNAFLDVLLNVSPEMQASYSWKQKSLGANSGLQLARLAGGFEIGRQLSRNVVSYIPDEAHRQDYSNYAKFNVSDIGTNANNNTLKMKGPFITMWAKPFMGVSSSKNVKGGYGLKANIKTNLYGTLVGSSINYGENNKYQSGAMIALGNATAKNKNEFVKTKNDANYFGLLGFNKIQVTPQIAVTGYAGYYKLKNDVTQANIVDLSGKANSTIMQLGGKVAYTMALDASNNPWILTPSVGIDYEKYKQKGFDVYFKDMNTNQYTGNQIKHVYKSESWSASLVDLPIKLDISKNFNINKDNKIKATFMVGYRPSFGKTSQTTNLRLEHIDVTNHIKGANLTDKQNGMLGAQAQWAKDNMSAAINYTADFSAHHFDNFVGFNFGMVL